MRWFVVCLAALAMTASDALCEEARGADGPRLIRMLLAAAGHAAFVQAQPVPQKHPAGAALSQ